MKLLKLKQLASALFVVALVACNRENPAQAQTAAAPAAAPNTTTATTAAPAAEAPKLPAGWVRYEAVATGNNLRMDGDSTLHKWKMETKIVGGYFEADEKFPESAVSDPAAAKANAYSFTPVKSYRSHAKKMDEIMQDSMNATQHPKIEYKLLGLKLKSPASTTGPVQFDATGALTISGVTLTNTMTVTIEKVDGKLKITGSTPIKMSDYKVKPKLTGPASLMTVEDNLVITFEWHLAPKAK
jgi:hypothetical protein